MAGFQPQQIAPRIRGPPSGGVAVRDAMIIFATPDRAVRVLAAAEPAPEARAAAVVRLAQDHGELGFAHAAPSKSDGAGAATAIWDSRSTIWAAAKQSGASLAAAGMGRNTSGAEHECSHAICSATSQ